MASEHDSEFARGYADGREGYWTGNTIGTYRPGSKARDASPFSFGTSQYDYGFAAGIQAAREDGATATAEAEEEALRDAEEARRWEDHEFADLYDNDEGEEGLTS